MHVSDIDSLYYFLTLDLLPLLLAVYVVYVVVIRLLSLVIGSDCPDASVVHASGSGQLQANPHVARAWLSPGKPTRRAVITMGSSKLVVCEVHVLGPSCQRYNWQTGRRGSMVFGSSPRR